MPVWNIAHINEMDQVARRILEINTTKKIAFEGVLGSGKTTLIKYICKNMGINEIVDSPTFNILHEYQNPEKVYHFDLFRLNHPDELYDIGYEEYFFSEAWVFVEWPEKAASLISSDFDICRLEILGENQRKIMYRS
jgi:tRNA threonylcarbamoyladenosine biosynthesis protein TsaE